MPQIFFRRLRLTVLCALALCCAGCVLAYGVSGHKEYRPYIGQTVTLTHPLLLVDCHSALFANHGVRVLGYARYGLAEPDAHWAPSHLFAKLPKGYPLTIDSVVEEITGDNAVDVFYGHIVNPTDGRRGSFAYTYHKENLPWRLAAAPAQ